MAAQRKIRRWIGLAGVAVLLTMGAACNGAVSPTATPSHPTETRPTQPPAPSATAQPQAPTAAPTEPEPTTIPSPSPEPPTPAPPSALMTWYPSETMALVVSGDYSFADLYALHLDGTLTSVLSDVGDEARVSPDGRWLGFVRWQDDGSATLELHDALTGESRQVTQVGAGGLLNFAFDPESRRLAYLDLGAYGEQGAPWALVVLDLETGASSRYDALMTGPDNRPLPGVPVGWSRAADELLIDTFLPGTEAGWLGVWGVTLPADGASAPLDALPLREIIPAAPAYSSQPQFAPDGATVAFLGRDPGYTPENYFPEFYDLAVNWLGIASLPGGARNTIVRADDGSALARALSWSPDGTRLLYAQGRYDGENFASLSLKSADLSGTVVEYGPLTLPPMGGLLELSWCDPSQTLYVTWGSEDGLEHLVSFNMYTGVSTELSVGQRLEIIGCAP